MGQAGTPGQGTARGRDTKKPSDGDSVGGGVANLPDLRLAVRFISRSGLRSCCLRDEGLPPSGVGLGLEGASVGAHGPMTAQTQPAPFLDSGLRLAGAGSASSPCGRRWGSAGRRAGPAPGPPAATGATLTSAGGPPLLADSAGLLAPRGACPCPCGRLCWGRGRNQPNAGRGVPGPTPRKRRRTRARRTTSQRPASPLWAGPSVLSTPGSGSPGRGPVGEGRGQGVEGASASHPLTGRLTPLTELCTARLLCLRGPFQRPSLLPSRSVRVHTLRGAGSRDGGASPFRMESRPPALLPQTQGSSPSTPAWTSGTGA